MIVHIKNCKSVICLDGDLPISFLAETKLDIIAVDGAANRLLENGVKPSIVVGDMDSVNSEVLSTCNCLELMDQDYTDFEKAVLYAKEKNLTPSVITGINGGYLDKIFMNISVFSQTDSVFLSDDMVGMIISGEREFQLPLLTKISIFGINEAVVSSQGLKWELNQSRMSFGNFFSCSNRTVSEGIRLVVEGKAWIFIYLRDVTDRGKWE